MNLNLKSLATRLTNVSNSDGSNKIQLNCALSLSCGYLDSLSGSEFDDDIADILCAHPLDLHLLLVLFGILAAYIQSEELAQ